jgi:TPR repeat protein
MPLIRILTICLLIVAGPVGATEDRTAACRNAAGFDEKRQFSANLKVPRAPSAAIRLCQQALDESPGNADIQAHLGHLLLATRKHAEGAELLRQASAKNATAQVLLGRLHENGWLVSDDEEAAVTLYRLGADAGDAEALFHLGRLGLESGKPWAMPTLLKAAEGGHIKARYLVWLWKLGTGCADVPTHDASLLQATAAAGEPRAASLDDAYQESLGAEAGNAVAQFARGQYFAQLSTLLPTPDQRRWAREEERAWIARAAGQGHVPATLWQGQRHVFDAERGRDDPTFRHWVETILRPLAEKGGAEAQFELGAVLYDPDAQDHEDADAWFAKSATQDYEEARQYQAYQDLKRLAGAGDAESSFKLGKLYQDLVDLATPWERYGPDDNETREKTARTWFIQAARRGHLTAARHIQLREWEHLEKTAPDSSVAQNGLGEFHAHGWGVPGTSVFQARIFLNLAAANGHPEARRTLAWLDWLDGQPGNPPDHTRDALLTLAAQGSSLAMRTLARLHTQGESTAHKATEALAWLEKAADQGDTAARTELVARLLDEEGGQYDYDRAMKLLDGSHPPDNTYAGGLVRYFSPAAVPFILDLPEQAKCKKSGPAGG